MEKNTNELITYSNTTEQWNLCWVPAEALSQNTGSHVQFGKRLGIVISNNINNHNSGVANIILCTSNAQKTLLPINYKFFCETTNLTNTALCNQIVTVPIIQLGQLPESLQTQDRLGIKKCLEIQFDSTLQKSDYISKPIIKTEIKEIPIEIIKEVTMADIDEKYKIYLEAQQFEEEAKRLTATALEEYTRAYEDLKEKLVQHSDIIGDTPKGPEKAAYESKSKPEEPEKTSVIKKDYSEKNEVYHKSWTKEEISILKGYTKSYINKNILQLQELLGRTEKAIKVKVIRLGIK